MPIQRLADSVKDFNNTFLSCLNLMVLVQEFGFFDDNI